ncbi:response regulator transcription factor [Edaphocola aurantiacus]|uniref:response regulator transcription factor n=1 Tax=Edaphocola aurantiacus TaxID=2601682 RepID=UPI001C9665E0|nr:response regulator transcription factor [Edaphocola aurantiacus]
MEGKKILYIEDEQALARIVTDMLRLKGYQVLHKEDGQNILSVLNNFQPDLCIFDIMLPHINGLSIAQIVRGIDTKLPIIFLSAKGQGQDVIDGFSAGANDYIRKPFSIDELMVRVQYQLKQKENPAELQSGTHERVFGDCSFNPQQYTLKVGTELYTLSQRESEILSMLFLDPDTIINRRELLLSVWGDDTFYNSRNLDVYIRKIRNYFQASAQVSLVTLKSVGFKMILK